MLHSFDEIKVRSFEATMQMLACAMQMLVCAMRVFGFVNFERSHLMENVPYNDLVRKGLGVNARVAKLNTYNDDGKKMREQPEVGFASNRN